MILVIEHSEAAGIGRLADILSRYAHRTRVIRLHRGDALPVDLDDVDGVISCGGPQSANDDDAALKAEMKLLRAAHERAMPVLGLCLGSQLLAKALGGEVGALPGNALEIGWHPVKLTAIGREDPLFAGIGWTTEQLHWHGEAVTKLPPGARLFALSDACPIQAWGAGLRTYAIQYHPEWTDVELRNTIETSSQELVKAGVNRDTLLRESETRWPEATRLAERLFESWILFVAPVDRRYAGLAKH